MLKFPQKEDFFASESLNCSRRENVLNSLCSRLVSPFGSISGQLGS